MPIETLTAIALLPLLLGLVSASLVPPTEIDKMRLRLEKEWR